MIANSASTMNNSSVRHIQSKVEFYNGSTLATTVKSTDNLMELTVARAGERGKLFGFGVCQQATVRILDTTGNLNITKGEKLRTYFNADNSDDYTRVCPSFFVKDAIRAENANIITVTAYDALDSSVSHVFNDLGMSTPYTLKSVVERISSLLGLTTNITDTAFDLSYPNGANLQGTETLRAVLNAIAEVTQTIYYIDHNDELVFKRLDKLASPVIDINKNDYFELQTALPVTISKIMHVTELGDNMHAGDDTGICQYVRNNPFWENRADLGTLLQEALNRVYGLTIVPYNLNWRGQYLTEICDKISFANKKGNMVDSYLLDDIIHYTGGMVETSTWEYTPESERISASNPATLGDKLNQTFAKVDKVNKEITLLVSDAENTKSELSALQLTSDEIAATVSSLETTTNSNMEALTYDIETLSKEVSLKVSSDNIAFVVQQALNEGVDRVVTSAKEYTFDDTGLNISTPDSEISTQITEDGMKIYKNTTEVLTADNKGVKATDLHAVTYLLIGENSRLEDKDGNRTACFWIGRAGG